MSEKMAQEPFSGEPPAGSVMRYLVVCMGVAALLATVFTAWRPAGLAPGELAGQLLAVLEGRQATATPGAAVAAVATPSALRIGIVVGHAGPNRETGLEDPGAVCPDGLTELDVNRSIARLVARGLEAADFKVDLLDEWDPRLAGYRAVALVSIHADTCFPVSEDAAGYTGYKVAAALETSVPDRAQRLVTCLADRYAQATGLHFQPGSITKDMTGYHTFYEIHHQTPAAIIETGFLYLDRAFLTEQPERAARGIVEGLLCYVNNEPATLPGQGSP